MKVAIIRTVTQLTVYIMQPRSQDFFSVEEQIGPTKMYCENKKIKKLGNRMIRSIFIINLIYSHES